VLKIFIDRIQCRLVKEEQYNNDDYASNFYRGGAKTLRNAKKYPYISSVGLCVLATPMFVATKARRHEVFKYEAQRNAFKKTLCLGVSQ
jgi:hypothetical protein